MAKTTAPWTEQEEEILRKMPTAPASRVMQVLESHRDKQDQGFDTVRSESAIRHKRAAMRQAVPEDFPEPETFRSRFEEVQAIQSKHYSGVTKGVQNYRQTGKQTKILSFSDVHFPFARLDLLEQGMKDHADADILILNGDIIEGYAFSSYDKSRTIYATEEYRCLFNFVQMGLDRFPEVHLVEGNHEDRLARFLHKQGIGSTQSALFGPSIMQRIANGEEIDKDGNTVAVHQEFKNRVHFRQKEAWWRLIGKTLFIHPSNKISANPGFTAVNWDRVFNLRWPAGTYDALVTGHTHCIYKGVVGGHLLMEQGCGSGFMDYEFNRREASLMKAMNGYAVVYQDEHGNTDFNRSNVIYCGYVSPVDPQEPISL